MAMISRQWRRAVDVVVVVAVVAVIPAGGFVEGSETDGSCAAVTCPVNITCLNGKCKMICDAGYADSNGNFLDGCEVNYLDGDVANRGRCGRQCTAPKVYEFVKSVNGQREYLDKCAAVWCAAYPNADTTCIRGQSVVKCQRGSPTARVSWK